MTILNKMMFHFNPKLCFNLIVELHEKARPPGSPPFLETDISRWSNGDKVTCNEQVGFFFSFLFLKINELFIYLYLFGFVCFVLFFWGEGGEGGWFFRAVSEQFQSCFRAVSEQFQRKFRANAEQMQSNFRAISGQFQVNFSAISGQYQSSFRAVSEEI